MFTCVLGLPIYLTTQVSVFGTCLLIHLGIRAHKSFCEMLGFKIRIRSSLHPSVLAESVSGMSRYFLTGLLCGSNKILLSSYQNPGSGPRGRGLGLRFLFRWSLFTASLSSDLSSGSSCGQTKHSSGQSTRSGPKFWWGRKKLVSLCGVPSDSSGCAANQSVLAQHEEMNILTISHTRMLGLSPCNQNLPIAMV